MATYEELINSAEQIRTNELPESNTHELVGKHLKNQVEHFNSENQGVKGQITALNKNTGISGYPVWKPNTAYAKGVVILNPDGQLVKNTVEQLDSGGTYNPVLWETTSLDKENREKVAELSSENGVVSSKIGLPIPFEYGGIQSGEGLFVDNNIRIRSNSIYSYVGENKIRLEYPNTLLYLAIFAFEGNKYVKSMYGNIYSDNILSFTNDGTFDNVRIVFKKADEAEISEDELNETKAYSLASIEDDISSLYSVAFSSILSELEYGGINTINGELVDNNIRIRSNSIYSYVGENKIRLEYPNTLLFNSIISYQGESFVKQIVSFSIKNNILSFTNDGTFDNVRIVFKKADEAEISEDELNETKAYASIENDISSIKNDVQSLITSLEVSVSLEYGGINTINGELVDNNIRIRSNSIYSYVGENKIRLEYPNTLLFNSIISYQGEAFVKQIVSFSIKNNILSFTNDGTFDNVRIVFKKADEAEISEDELNETKAYSLASIEDDISSIKNDVQSLITSLEVLVSLEYGGINTINGELVDNNIRIRTEPIYYKGDGLKQISCTIPNYIMIVCIYAYMGTLPVKKIVNYSFYNNRIRFETDDTFDNVRVSFVRTDDGEFTQDDIVQCRIATIFNPDYCYSAVQSLKYASLGDSITYGFIPRNYDGYPGQLNSYAKLAAEKLGMNFVNYGISGSTIANVSGRNPMSVRYADMVDDADIITVMGGTNDVRNGVSLGTMDDRTNDTFYGALHVLYQGLYDKYIGSVDTSIGKGKKIIVITPIKLLDSTKSKTENTVENNAVALEQWDDWINAIKEVAAFYSFPVLDFYNLSGITPHINRTVQGYEDGYTGYYNPYITDGTHPTQEGHEIMANVLVGFIKSLGIVE